MENLDIYLGSEISKSDIRLRISLDININSEVIQFCFSLNLYGHGHRNLIPADVVTEKTKYFCLNCAPLTLKLGKIR